MWKSLDKAQAKSLDDRGSVGYLLDIDVWQSGTTRVMQDGVVVKGLAPKRLDPARYHINPSTDLNELEKGMPWRSIQDEFGKLKWIDPSGRIYQGTPFSVEPDITAKHVFIASMMHTSMRSPRLRDLPDVTCPSDFPDSEKRQEVVHHEQIPDYDVKKPKRQQANDKKSNVVIKAKSIPVTPKSVASSTGSMREKWLVSIYKGIENFLQNMAIEDADSALVVRWKSLGKSPLPCQMEFVLRPLTQSQQKGDDVQKEYKHKSRLVICGNFASWGEHSTTTTNLDAPILVKMDIVKPNTVWHVKKAIYGLREAPRLWQQERDQKLRDLELMYQNKFAHLVQSYIHPSLWFIAEGSKSSTLGDAPL